MNARLDELIQRYLEGRATPEEDAALQQMLKQSAEARAVYLDYVNLDVALGAAADAAAVEGRSVVQMPVAQPRRFRWWLYAAAACLAFALSVGLLPHRKQSPARPDVAAAMESAESAIAQMPAPSEASAPEWMSPTASLLDLDLPHLPSSNLKHPL